MDGGSGSLDRKGLTAGTAAMGLLLIGIVLGSGTLRHYDPILLTYTFGALFSVFAIAYRYAVWLQRPPTQLYWKRGWELLMSPGRIFSQAGFLISSFRSNMVTHRFIRKRSFSRWAIHFLIAWGSLIAFGLTFPLVFGWLRFESLPSKPEVYQIIFLGVGVGSFDATSWMRLIMFNMLNVAAVMVTVGAGLALRRRLRDGAAIGRQQFGNDIVPLLLLLGISVTGLMLTFSMYAMAGAGYAVLSLVHALVVSATLLYIPFGKFFHVFQRPLQLGVTLYRRENETGPQASCRSCGAEFAGAMHVADLKGVMDASGFQWGGLMDVCPPCKRKSMARSQAALTAPRREPESMENHGNVADCRA